MFFKFYLLNIMKDFNMGKDLKGIWKGGQNARLEFKIDSTTNEQ